MKRNPTAAILFSLFLAACTSGDDKSAEPQHLEQERFVAPTCASAAELCLEAPASGFQIRSEGTEILPGEDVEYCEVVTLPGGADELYYVNAFESQMTAGSHHLIVAAIDPGTKTDEKAEPGARVPCAGPDVFGGELQPVTGAQQPYSHEQFPAGVGRTYHGGQKVVFDYHYFNTSSAPITARAAVNFHTTDAANVDKVARAFGFYNLAIEILPGEDKTFSQECLFDEDLYVHKLTRHTHRWGTDFEVWQAGGEHDGAKVLSSPDYETVDFPFEEPLFMPAGSGFRFSCSYKNTEDYTLVFGLEATDEMCILFGSWYVEGDQDVPGQSCYRF